MIHTSGLFLAIDQSTSATKALLFTTSGSLIDQETLQHQQIYPQAGWVEHDADEIYNNLLNMTSTLLMRHPDPTKANHLFASWQTAVQQVLYQPKQG